MEGEDDHILSNCDLGEDEKEPPQYSSGRLSRLLLKYYRFDLQGAIAVLGSGDLSHNLGTRRLRGITDPVGSALHGFGGFGIACCIEFVGLVRNKECER